MGSLEITVITSFGCICCGCMSCQLCGRGRKYPVTVRKTDMISAIWDEMKRQNPQIDEKKVQPDLIFKNEPLEQEKRVINYDIEDGAKIIAMMPPALCCTKVFRKAPKKRRQAFTDEEVDDQAPNADGQELQRKQQKTMDQEDDTTV
eukprot:Protomagalhaensia_sp_Gyna_25__3508@NODE_3153_length_707_cov_302_943114_g2638_i0_p1_GENE_NODE_3153_length_707_cov_302_943114_g2638_i0NODE_3153_length_707_cov_302_943114_g2638_i0_p1_ORF_typecomplete_len147_score32_44ubiquitin/PF00240_23/0_0052Rad60SLD/PF11976_8/0_072Rad60SLD/PF11976_8/1e04_NODE_3153_length_707_cov_302_943114_g2638_i0195635